MIDVFVQTITDLWQESGLAAMQWQNWVMIAISFVLVYLAIVKGFEPLLLLPIAFGMFLTNLPMTEMFHMDYFVNKEIDFGQVMQNGGLLNYLYLGVKLGIYPSLIFLGIGAMTDFGPLIANPKSFLLGAAAQLGIFVTFVGAVMLGFSPEFAAAIMHTSVLQLHIHCLILQQ